MTTENNREQILALAGDPVAEYIGTNREYGYEVISLYEEIPGGAALYTANQVESTCSAAIQQYKDSILAEVGEPAVLPFAILAEELADLRRFHECVMDNEGYDVPKARMKRLAEIGLLRHASAGYYEQTVFGLSVLNGDFDNFIAARKPLEELVAEFEAEVARKMSAGEFLIQQNTELTKQRDGLAQDAARYRWLRDQHWCEQEATFRLGLSDTESMNEYHAELDAAIDDAIASVKGGAA